MSLGRRQGDATRIGVDLLEEQDVDIMAWAIGTDTCPERYRGSILEALQTLNYVPIAE